MSAPLTNTQISPNAILDVNGTQTYLGNSFVVPTPGTSLTNTVETPLVYLQNPAGSGKSLFFFKKTQTTNNNTVIVKYYLNPTPNVLGVRTAVINLRSKSTTPSISVCYLSPTFSGNGTLITALPATTNGVSSTALYILDQGDSMLITGTQVGAGTTTTFSEIGWYEI